MIDLDSVTELVSKDRSMYAPLPTNVLDTITNSVENVIDNGINVAKYAFYRIFKHYVMKYGISEFHSKREDYESLMRTAGTEDPEQYVS